MIKTNSKGCPLPTKKQIEVFEMAVEAYKDSDCLIETEMDTDGSMLLIQHNDGARSMAFFDTKGNLIGDWIW